MAWHYIVLSFTCGSIGFIGVLVGYWIGVRAAVRSVRERIRNGDLLVPGLEEMRKRSPPRP